MDSYVTLTLDRIIFLLHSFASRTLSADYVSVCGVRLWTTRSQVCFPAEKKKKGNEPVRLGFRFNSKAPKPEEPQLILPSLRAKRRRQYLSVSNLNWQNIVPTSQGVT